MTRIHRALLVIGAAVGASALIPPAPASADTITKHAHALFQSAESRVSMAVDVTKRGDGSTTIDVEWTDYECAEANGAYVCNHVFRNSHDVPVRRFSFSLTGATVSASLPYQEIRRTCRILEEQETCTEEYDVGETTIQATWTPNTEPTRSTRIDENGRTVVTTSVVTALTGTAYGLSYGGPSSVGWLTKVRTIDPTA
ncbi:hypothetical protein ABNF97_07770 [Plantactinospora sp. B6F1]|uniref:hypothetical protein n=1 Tax=Plantactinospora sp. B6F1 TaxID=3158971 RepID=UPI00102C27B4